MPLETIWVAVIGGICTAVPSIFATYQMNRQNTTLINYRLDQMEKTLQNYNSLIQKINIIETKVSALTDRVGSLEDRG